MEKQREKHEKLIENLAKEHNTLVYFYVEKNAKEALKQVKVCQQLNKQYQEYLEYVATNMSFEDIVNILSNKSCINKFKKDLMAEYKKLNNLK